MKLLTHADFLALRRFPALDGLRAIAAIMVVFGHFGGPKWAPMAGWLGVHLFFVISGFLITTLALREEDRRGRVSLRNFYLRRVFRIMPVYYVVLALTLVLYLLRGEYLSQHADVVLPYYLTFNNEYIAHGMFFGHSWTLAIEQKFYLVWPLLAFAFGAIAFNKRLGVAIGVTVLMAANVAYPVFPQGVFYVNILLGCVLAILMHSPRGFAAVRQLTRPALGAVLAAVLVVVHFSAVDSIHSFGTDHVVILVYGVVVFLMLPGLLNGGPLEKFLSTRPMEFLGARSYSIYLVQEFAASIMLLSVPMFAVHRTVTAVAVTVASIMLADLLYRWVEVPMINLGKRLIGRLDRPKPAPEPEPVRELVPNTV